MNTIYKYRIPEHHTRLQLPEKSKIISAGAIHGEIYVWAEVDTDTEPSRTHDVYVFGTGHTMPDCPGRFIGSVQTRDGLVFHLYVQS